MTYFQKIIIENFQKIYLLKIFKNDTIIDEFHHNMIITETKTLTSILPTQIFVGNKNSKLSINSINYIFVSN